MLHALAPPVSTQAGAFQKHTPRLRTLSPDQNRAISAMNALTRSRRGVVFGVDRVVA